MTAVLYFAKIAAGAIMKNWKAIVAGLLIGAALWIFCDWLGQAAEIAALEYEVKTERALTRQWRDISRLQSAKALEAAEKRDEFEDRLAELLANPPTVTVWKTAEPTIHEIIVESEDCASAVEDLGKLLKGLSHE